MSLPGRWDGWRLMKRRTAVSGRLAAAVWCSARSAGSGASRIIWEKVGGRDDEAISLDCLRALVDASSHATQAHLTISTSPFASTLGSLSFVGMVTPMT